MPLASRLDRLPHVTMLGLDVRLARGPRARLLGLAFLERSQTGAGLLIPRCAAVHTCGMRFQLDLVFLDAAGRPLLVCRRVPPRRFVWLRSAAAVLELPSEAGCAALLAAKSSQQKEESNQ